MSARAKRQRIAVANSSNNDLNDLKTAIKSTLKKRYVDPAFEKLDRRVGALHIWRINALKLDLVKPSEYGQFYDGDSYLILKIKPDENKDIVYNIHTWIGKYSTRDEYTTAAIKSSELDKTILGGAGTLIREVQDNETDDFLELFTKMSILKGGNDPAGNRVRKQDSTTSNVERLLHVSGVRGTVKIVEVSYRFENLNSDDVFIVQKNDKIYQLNGKTANLAEKTMAMEAIVQMKEDNSKLTVEVIDENVDGFNHSVIAQMPRKNKATLKKLRNPTQNNNLKPTLYKLSDATGEMLFTVVSTGPFTKSMLDGKDVFLFDNINTCYVWIGRKASDDERNLSVVYGYSYLQKNNRHNTQMLVIPQGKESRGFRRDFLKKK